MKQLNLSTQFKGLDVNSLTVLNVDCGYYTSTLSAALRNMPFEKLISTDTHAPIIINVSRQKTFTFAAKEHELYVRSTDNLGIYDEFAVDVIVVLSGLSYMRKAIATMVLRKMAKAAKKRVIVWLPVRKPQTDVENTAIIPDTFTKEELEDIGFHVNILEGFDLDGHPDAWAAWATHYKRKPLQVIESEVSLSED